MALIMCLLLPKVATELKVSISVVLDDLRKKLSISLHMSCRIDAKVISGLVKILARAVSFEQDSFAKGENNLGLGWRVNSHSLSSP
jgi:hypothetical protein